MVSKTQYQPPRTILLSGVALVVIAIASSMFLFLGGSHQSQTNSPRLVVGPSTAKPGATLSVSGFNYSPVTGVKVYFQNPANGVVNTDTSPGGFFNVSLTLPRQISGTSNIYAVSNSETASALVSVLNTSSGAQDTLTAASSTQNTASIPSVAGPTLRVTPAAGPRGTLVKIRGFRFDPNSTATITFQGNTVATAPTLGNGSFFASFQVLSSALGGTWNITATSSTQNSSFPFKVLSPLSITPRRGVPGAKVYASGGVFTPGGTVQVILVCPHVSCIGTPLGTFPVASNGTIGTPGPVSFTIPAVAPGLYGLAFLDSSGAVTNVSYPVYP